MSETYVYNPKRRFMVQRYIDGRWRNVQAFAKVEDADALREQLDPTPKRVGWWVPKARVADLKGH